MPHTNYHLHLKGVVGGPAKALPRFTLPATPHNNKVQQVARFIIVSLSCCEDNKCPVYYAKNGTKA